MEYEKIIKNIIYKWNKESELNIPSEALKTLCYEFLTNNVPHSSKQARKASQQYRREAKKIFTGYQADLNQTLGRFNEALRKKTKYCPSWLWRFGAGIFIDIAVLEKPFKKPE